MFEEATHKTLFLITAAVLYLANSLSLASGITATQTDTFDAEQNHLLVVHNMSADFRSFGIGTQQARMLAEQTADFGVLGMLTTMAAVGIDPFPGRRIALVDTTCLHHA